MIRVLIVDDDFMVAKVHSGFVAALDGFEVAGTAHTGAAALEEVFASGFTTKAAKGGPRGFGLALTWTICTRRGGTVSVRNDDGAVFSACLPISAIPAGAR